MRDRCVGKRRRGGGFVVVVVLFWVGWVGLGGWLGGRDHAAVYRSSCAFSNFFLLVRVGGWVGGWVKSCCCTCIFFLGGGGGGAFGWLSRL